MSNPSRLNQSRSLTRFFRSIATDSINTTRSAHASRPRKVSIPSLSRSFSHSTRKCQPPTPISYPFASQALTQNSPLPLRSSSSPTAPSPKSIQKAVLPTVHESLKQDLDPTSRLTNLFKRGSPTIIPSGSVLIIETWSNTSKTSFNSFSGVLISVRRRGVSTSFVVRNLVLKLGVEVRFNLYSPLLKDIKVVMRANATKQVKKLGKKDEGKMGEKKPNKGINDGDQQKSLGLRRTRRAQLYYLRKDDRKLNAVGNVIKKMREEEERKKLTQQRRRR